MSDIERLEEGGDRMGLLIGAAAAAAYGGWLHWLH